MKFIEKITKKFVKTASIQTKEELKKTAIDLLPTVITIVTTVVGVMIFQGASDTSPKPIEPRMSSTTITTNNYFFKDMTEESIKKILEER